MSDTPFNVSASPSGNFLETEMTGRDKVIQMFPEAETRMMDLDAVANIYYNALSAGDNAYNAIPFSDFNDLWGILLKLFDKQKQDSDIALVFAYYFYLGSLPELVELFKKRKEYYGFYEDIVLLNGNDLKAKSWQLVSFIVEHVNNEVLTPKSYMQNDHINFFLCPLINLILSIDPKFDLRRFKFKVELDEYENATAINFDSVWEKRKEMGFDRFLLDVKETSEKVIEIRRYLGGISPKDFAQFYINANEDDRDFIEMWLRNAVYEATPSSGSVYSYKLNVIQAIKFSHMASYQNPYDAKEFLYRLGDIEDVYYFFQACHDVLNAYEINGIYKFLSENEPYFADIFDLMILRLEVVGWMTEGLESRLAPLFTDINKVKNISTHTYLYKVKEVAGILLNSKDESKKLIGSQMMSYLNLEILNNEMSSSPREIKYVDPVLSQFVEDRESLVELFGRLSDEDKINLVEELRKYLLDKFPSYDKRKNQLSPIGIYLESKIDEFEKT